MTLISKSGNLLTALLVVYPEKSELLVKKKKFRADNIYIISTKAGKIRNKELNT